MSLLSYNQILDLLEDGVVENAIPEHVNSSSLDITLGRYILVETMNNKLNGYMPYVLSLAQRDALNTKKVDLRALGHYHLKPGEFILAQTQEIFNLPCDISAEYKLKSSMARVGLEHLNAGWADSGWHGSVLTLELRNMTTYHEIELKQGDKIGQMVFYKHAPVPIAASYANRGTYNKDTEVSGAKKELSKFNEPPQECEACNG
jgi:deoxycytidine triphosphate deaminase